MTQATQLLGLDPKLVFDLAARVDPPNVIAANYGLDPQYLSEVVEIPHVKTLINAKRKELDDTGFVLAAKAKLMFEDLLPDVYKKAKSENTTLSGVLEAAKFMRTVAGLDKQDLGNGPAEKFSITINFSGAAPSSPAQTIIDVTPPGTGGTPTFAPSELQSGFLMKDSGQNLSADLGSIPVFVLGKEHNLSDLEYREA